MSPRDELEPPSERLIGGVPAGENRIDHTPLLCPRSIPATDPSSSDHILMVLSCEADANTGAVGETSMALMSFSCATRV